MNNFVYLQGRIKFEPYTTETKNGKFSFSFKLGVKRIVNGKNFFDDIECIYFANNYDVCKENIKKDNYVSISGILTTTKWEDKDTKKWCSRTQVLVTEISLAKPIDVVVNENYEKKVQETLNKIDIDIPDIDDDDLPF